MTKSELTKLIQHHEHAAKQCRQMSSPQANSHEEWAEKLTELREDIRRFQTAAQQLLSKGESDETNP